MATDAARRRPTVAEVVGGEEDRAAAARASSRIADVENDRVTMLSENAADVAVPGVARFSAASR
uniref:hypothetical protein n=1 Tax=Paractinoplanes polyasparticus TaxID=2856853 RepID=UPI001C860122|nr:hypothetical protein [Actinoplanes polyasparticus]